MKNLKAVSSVLLCITVFSTGAVTMIIELLGAKLLAPFFGTSLYTWTAVIATTLSALAGGYYYGGRISDTLSKEATDRKLQSGGGKLFGMIALAGAFLALVPAFQMGGLKVCSNFGLRGGALAASVLFMAFPLFIMGTVMPQVVKLAFRQDNQGGIQQSAD